MRRHAARAFTPAPTFDPARCKICEGPVRPDTAHSVRCTSCGALLYYPYPSDESLAPTGTTAETREQWTRYYLRCTARNSRNFADMIDVAMAGVPTGQPLTVLDYGGGGGQFALVMRARFPNASIWITDISDDALLPQWAALNTQIPFRQFAADHHRFDVVFLNDVYEHVSDPVAVLALVASKLAAGGRIFIDTPRPFWLYPVLRLLAPPLYRRLVRGTVSRFHLQLWSRRAFATSVRQAGLVQTSYRETSEFTMGPQFYLTNMGITHPVVRGLGIVFYRLAPWLARNKIMAVLERPMRTL